MPSRAAICAARSRTDGATRKAIRGSAAALPDRTTPPPRGLPNLLRHGPGAVLYVVVDRVVDDYSLVLDALDHEVDQGVPPGG